MLKLLDIITIICVDGEDIKSAFNLPFKDFEDALQAQCANKVEADYIVTRNMKDFVSSKVKAISTENLLMLI